MSEEFYGLISKILGVPQNEINDESSPQTISSWTSFKGYVMLYELEQKFNVKFSIDEAMMVKKVGDIKLHLQHHGVKIE